MDTNGKKHPNITNPSMRVIVREHENGMLMYHAITIKRLLVELDEALGTIQQLEGKLDKYLREDEIDAKIRRNMNLSHQLMAGEISFDQYKLRFED